MKFFNIDLHISVIADLANIFEKLGHHVDINYLSDHSWVFEKNPINNFFINQSNWWDIDSEMCIKFFETHKEELNSYDGFIVTHIPAISLLYEKFNKPIIFVASTRYEYPFTNDRYRWEWFNDYINNNKNIFCVANNLYDKWYCEQFLNKTFDYIPSLCEYTGSTYIGDLPQNLIFSKFLTINGSDYTHRSKLGKYKWGDIMRYKSIIHFPYNVSTMSIFEQYTSNVPLFFPTKKLNFDLSVNGYTMTELSYCQVMNLSNRTVVGFKNNLDPNDYRNIDLINKSIDLSDFYNENMREIILFETFEDLFYKIKNVDLGEVSKRMFDHNRERKTLIFESWRKILENLKN